MVVILKPDTQNESLSAPPPRCTFCAELAVGENAQGMPMCGIPGNHHDDEIVKFF